jgi:hypothetical protein
MKIKRLGLLVIFLLQASFVFAEDVKIATYYPSPEGDYKRLRTTDETNLATTAETSASARVSIGNTNTDAGTMLKIKGTGNTDATQTLQLLNSDNNVALSVLNDRTTVVQNLRIQGGSPAANKVLTSDASGNASWQAPVAGSNVVSSGIYGYCHLRDSTRAYGPVCDSVKVPESTGCLYRFRLFNKLLVPFRLYAHAFRS